MIGLFIYCLPLLDPTGAKVMSKEIIYVDFI